MTCAVDWALKKQLSISMITLYSAKHMQKKKEACGALENIEWIKEHENNIW